MRKEQLERVFAHHQQLIDNIPSFIASEAIKSNFMKMRRNLMIRTIQAEMEMKRRGEWTMPKLLEMARHEEKVKSLAAKAKMQLLHGSNNN